MNRHEYREDIVGIAAPIEALTPEVVEAAAAISERLGFRAAARRAGGRR